MIERTAQYLISLPLKLSERIVFIECCEGATGDPAPYYGSKTTKYWPEPLGSRYRISNAQWSEYRIETWQQFQKAFHTDRIHFPLLFKSADIHENEFAWLLANVPEIGSKQALFCEFYQISGSRERLRRGG